MAKKLIAACIGLFVCIPFVAFAQADYYSGITSETEAEASSGGNSAPGGTSISGSASASAEVHTTLEGGTITTEIETEENGVIHTETIKKNIPAGESVEIRIATSSDNTNVNIEVNAVGESAGEKAGFTSLFDWFFTPGVSALPAEDEDTEDSGFFKAEESIFSSFWVYVRAFFGF